MTSIDLKHVYVAAFSDLSTSVTLAAGVLSRPGNTVQRPGQDTSGRGLAHPPRPGKDKRLCKAVLSNRIAQRLRDATLPDNIGKFLRSPLTG